VARLFFANRTIALFPPTGAGRRHSGAWRRSWLSTGRESTSATVSIPNLHWPRRLSRP